MAQVLPCEELSFDVQVGGVRLRAKTILPPGTSLTGSGPVLVLLHEGLGSITQWRSFPLALVRATGLPALLYDRCGYGQSEAQNAPRDPSYLETEAFERLPELLRVCGIEAPILVGHSDGATIALLYAARFPQGPLGVISEAAHVFVEAISIQGIWRTLHAFETTPLREQLRAHHGDQVDAMFHRWSDVWLSPEFQDWTMVDQLAAIRCPVLALQGKEDEYGTPAQIRAITKAVSGPSEGLILPHCGHIPHFQASEAALAAMARFIEAIAARAGTPSMSPGMVKS